MAELGAKQAIAAGLAHHQAGRLGEAERLYRHALAAEPGNADALRLLGLVCHQTGRHEQAVELLKRSIAVAPAVASSHNNLGEAYRAMGKMQEALACYHRALELKRDFPEARNNLGGVLVMVGQRREGMAEFRAAIALRPGYARAHQNLGTAMLADGDARGAAEELAVAVKSSPANASALAALGDALSRLGKLDEARAAYQQALRISPGDADLHEGLGRVLREGEKLSEAVAAYQAAIRLAPNRASLYSNLGEAYRAARQVGPAIAALRRALELDPNLSEAHGNLATALASLGQHREAEEHFRAALRLNPGNIAAHSSLLMLMNYNPPADAKIVLGEHREWDRMHAAGLAPGGVRGVARPDGAKLRIGYVSADFWMHPVSFFIEPLLEHHDRSRFTVVCYADGRRKDEVTARLRGNADEWHELVGLSDEQAAARVREDRIDILVDLAGHTAGNRLLMFARRPAEIGATYLGYPNTTGMSAMDFRITDAYADPPGTEELYVERLVRLPRCFLCYRPLPDAPEVTSLPAGRAGYVTFGSFNKFAKVTAATMDCWRRLLARVEGSRLLIKSAMGADAESLQLTREVLRQNGLPMDRVEVLEPDPVFRRHLELYGRVDVALDTFPYNGTTTTCEALWMGVPVVALAGQTHAGRVGVSLLTNAGAPELIAETAEDYVEGAAALASDWARVEEYRKTLRTRMGRSALMDAKGFAQDMERAYAEMFERRASDR